MPSYRISASRAGGHCRAGYAHDLTIRPQQRTLVTTYFPGDEHVRDFGVAGLSRHRSCMTCTASKLREMLRTGVLHIIHGLKPQDLVDAGILTESDIAAPRGDASADCAVVVGDMQVTLADFRP